MRELQRLRDGLPVAIPLPQLILDQRARVVEALGLPWYKRAVFGAFARPWLFDVASRLAALPRRARLA